MMFVKSSACSIARSIFECGIEELRGVVRGFSCALISKLDGVEQTVMNFRIDAADAAGCIQIRFGPEHPKTRPSGTPASQRRDTHTTAQDAHHEHGAPCTSKPEQRLDTDSHERRHQENRSEQEDPPEHAHAVVPATRIAKPAEDIIKNGRHVVWYRPNVSAPRR